MKILVWICLFYMHTSQTFDISRIRSLYRSAPIAKEDAARLQDLLQNVNDNTAVPVLVCYKGANEMIQAKYAFNPFTKWEKFSKGKQLLQQAISRDTLDLEMRFIRFSIQSNLPSFLGYHDELNMDKRFLVENTKNTKDPELKKMIANYLTKLKKLKEKVILVDAGGNSTGIMDKLEAHQKGILHLAFSVFIFNNKGQLLLQQRALDKYHSAGLWTNTCCSHPRAGETIINAARRRLQEEMGMETELTELFQFSYRHEFENGLIEHEYDHVLIGTTDQLPELNTEEVANYRYADIASLLKNMREQPEIYTPWFRICLHRVLENYHQIN